MSNHIRLIEISLPPEEAMPAKVHVVYRDGGIRDVETFLEIDVKLRKTFPGISEFGTRLARGGKITFDFSAGVA